MQPRQLMQGNAVMRAIGPEERRYKSLLRQRDLFGKTTLRISLRLSNCINQCHGTPGVRSINSRQSRFTREQPTPAFKEGNPVAIGQATAAKKQEDDTWKALQTLWPRESNPKDDDQSNAAFQPNLSRPDQAQRRSGNTELKPRLPELRRFAPRSSLLVAQASLDAEPKPADKPKGLYHADPDHLWNRLHRDICARKDPGARERVVRVLREFLEKEGHTLIDDPLKRAFLQHDLWAYFDGIIPYFMEAERESSEVPTLIAKVIAKLALTKDEIKALPDNYAAVVKAKTFSVEFRSDKPPKLDIDIDKPITVPENFAKIIDHTSPKRAYLPTDLFTIDGRWLQFGDARNGRIAPFHEEGSAGRSSFMILVRHPEDRDSAQQYFKQFNREFSATKKSEDIDSKRFRWLTEKNEFPVDTQFALVRRMIVIDSTGQPVPTNLTESVELQIDDDATVYTSFYKYELDRSALFADPKTSLRRVGKDEQDPTQLRAQRFVMGCIVCHPAVPQSLDSSLDLRAIKTLKNGDGSATARWKSTRPDFKKLRELLAARREIARVTFTDPDRPPFRAESPPQLPAAQSANSALLSA
jgi:hypothetical protein